jgi:uncharacterized integral membrane protein
MTWCGTVDGPGPLEGGGRVYEQEQQQAESRKISPKLIVGIVLVVLALIFVFQNTAKRQVHLYFWHLDAPTWIWLIVVLAIGFVIGSLFPWFRRKPKS